VGGTTFVCRQEPLLAPLQYREACELCPYWPVLLQETYGMAASPGTTFPIFLPHKSLMAGFCLEIPGFSEKIASRQLPPLFAAKPRQFYAMLRALVIRVL
jgi:hypothetical protein